VFETRLAKHYLAFLQNTCVVTTATMSSVVSDVLSKLANTFGVNATEVDNVTQLHTETVQ